MKKNERIHDDDQDLTADSDVLDALLVSYADERKIVIDEDISPKMVRTVIIPLLRLDEDEEEQPIDIYLSTNGGDAATTLAICDVIDKLKCPTTIYILGYAYSGGLLIASAGRHNPNVKKIAYPSAEFMYHRLGGVVEGSLTRLEVEFDRSVKMQRKLDDYLLRNTELDEKTLRKHKDADWFFDTDAALRLGIVNEVL